MPNEKLIMHLGKAIERVLKSDASTEDKSNTVSAMTKSAASRLGQDGVFAAFDYVCTALDDPEAIRKLVPENPVLGEDGFMFSDKEFSVVKKFSDVVHKNFAPIFLGTPEVKPIAVMSLEMYNSLVASMDERLTVSPKSVISDITTVAEPPTTEKQ